LNAYNIVSPNKTTTTKHDTEADVEKRDLLTAIAAGRVSWIVLATS